MFTNIFLLFLSLLPFFKKIYLNDHYELTFRYDSLFNFRCAQYIEKNGISLFFNWYDDSSWYPYGRMIGETAYPGLPILCYFIKAALCKIHIFISLKNVCLYIGSIFSMLIPIFSYLLAELFSNNQLTSMIAAFLSCFNRIYYNESSPGQFDNQSISNLMYIICLYFFYKSLNTGKAIFLILNSITYGFYAITTGEYLFLENYFPFICLCILIYGINQSENEKKSSQLKSRTAKSLTQNIYTLYMTYSSWYIFGKLIPASIPWNCPKILFSINHSFSSLFFLLLNLYMIFYLAKKKLSQKSYLTLFLSSFVIWAFLCFICIAYLLFSIFFFEKPFFLNITSIANHVQENSPSNPRIFLFSLGPLFWVLPLFIQIILKERSQNSFILLISVSITFLFSAWHRRNLRIYAIFFIICSSIGINDVLEKIYYRLKFKHSFLKTIFAFAAFIFLLIWQIFPQQTLTNENIKENYEMMQWIKQNTGNHSKILAKWSDGFDIQVNSKRYTYHDGFTENSTYICSLENLYIQNEFDSWAFGKDLNIDYILITFGGLSENNESDLLFLSSFIAETKILYPKTMKFYHPKYPHPISEYPTKAVKNSTLFKLSYYNFNRYENNTQANKNETKWYDNLFKFTIHGDYIDLKKYEEVYTTSNWTKRLYRLLSNQIWG